MKKTSGLVTWKPCNADPRSPLSLARTPTAKWPQQTTRRGTCSVHLATT